MRSLSGALLAAQKAASGAPYVRTVVENKVRNVLHLELATDYSDSSSDNEHDAAGDGSYLHRARVNNGNAQYQRNASASWTTLSSTATASRVAIAAVNDQRVAAVYNRGNDLYIRESTDQGASFGAETLVVSVGAVTKALTVEYKTTSGDLVVIYEQSNQLRRIRRTGGSWGASAAWTLSANSINGVDAVRNIDLLIVLSGTDTSDRPTVWTCVLGDGVQVALDTWAQQFIVVQAESDEQIVFQAPFIDQLAADASLRLSYVEKFTGTPAYTRTFWTWRPVAATNPKKDWEWLDPVPLDNTTNQGLAIADGKTPDRCFLSRPGKVFAGLTAAQTLDLSPDLIGATLEERDGLDLRGEFVYDNSTGAYQGPPAPIALRRDVDIGLGYDALFSRPAHQSIVGWEYRREGGRSLFVLHTRGNAYWLARSRPRTTIALDAIKATEITRGAAQRAGLDYISVASSARANNFSLAWVIHPHQNSLEALRAVEELLPDVFLSGTSDFTVVIHEPKATDAVDYTFGTDHALYHSRTRDEGAASFAEIVGEGVLGQALDFGVMDDDKPIQDRRRDPHAAAAADASDHASARLRKAQLRKELGELLIPPHCGLEIADVVAYTDDLASAAQLKARVRSITTSFRRGGRGRQPVYEQRIGLGGL